MHLVDPPTNHTPSDPIPFDPASDRPSFPVFILAAPGLLCMLALAMPEALAAATRSEPALWAATAIAATGAVACFTLIATRSREKQVRYPAIAALGATILLILRAMLRLL